MTDYCNAHPEKAKSILLEQAALWTVSEADSADVVFAACDALVAGVDSPSLRLLAGVDTRLLRGSDRAIDELLQATLRELQLPICQPNTSAGKIQALYVLAERARSGQVVPRELARWVHSTFGHDLALVARLADLDDEYDVIDYGDRTSEQVDADVLRAVQEVLDHRDGRN